MKYHTSVALGHVYEWARQQGAILGTFEIGFCDLGQNSSKQMW